MRRKHKVPKKRVIDPRLVRRVNALDASSLFVNLDNILMGMHALVDNYRFHDAPGDEIGAAIDALYTLWSEILSREV